MDTPITITALNSGVPYMARSRTRALDENLMAAGVIITTTQGTALFLKRAERDGDPNGGEWCWPGGGLESGEDAETAAIRETREETGWIVEGPLHELDNRELNGVDFTTFETMAGNEFIPELNDEHVGWAWAPLDNPPQPLHSGCKKTLDMAALGMDADFKESDHPRGQPGNAGQFGSGGGSSEKSKYKWFDDALEGNGFKHAGGGLWKGDKGYLQIRGNVWTFTPNVGGPETKGNGKEEFESFISKGVKPTQSKSVEMPLSPQKTSTKHGEKTKNRWIMSPGNSSPSHIKRVTDTVHAAAKKLNFPLDKVKVLNERAVIPGGTMGFTGGSVKGGYHRGTKDISMFTPGIRGDEDEKQIQTIFVHEVTHAKFDSFLDKVKSNSVLEKQFKELTSNPGELRDAGEDVSNYAEQYWEKYEDKKIPLSTALHETLAEMSRNEVYGNKLIDTSTNGGRKLEKLYKLVSTEWDKR